MIIAWVNHAVALVVALAITNDTCLMASVGLLDLRAAYCRHLCHAFRVLGKLLVQPRHGECWAFAFTISVLACIMAGLDLWERLASLHEWQPRLGALGMASYIVATLHGMALVVACMSLLNLLVHLLPMLAVVLSVTLTMLVMVAMMMITMVVLALAMLVMVAMMMLTVLMMLIVLVMVMATMHLWTFVVALEVTRGASLVASMGLLDPWAHLVSLLNGALGILVEFLVHPVNIKLWALVTICVFASCAACLDGREV